MLTGRGSGTIGVWDTASPLSCDWPTFLHGLRAGGHATILCGKMHFVGPDQLHGFDERWLADSCPATFDWTRSNRAAAAVNAGQDLKWVLDAGVGWDDHLRYDEQVVALAEEGLRRLLCDHGRRPFFLCVSFNAPHYPFKAPQEYWDLYTDDDVDLPVLPDDYLQREHEYVRWIRHSGGMERLVPDDICRAARHAVLARITMLDGYLKRILDVLGEFGLWDETLVVYTSDHGDMMGEHGLWFKSLAYEWSSRVPLIVSGPGIPARRIAEPVSLLDVGPTLCGLTEVEPVYSVSDGRDLSSLLLARRDEGPGQAMIEYYGEGVWRGYRALRKGAHKMTCVPGCQPELFDLASDPDEWHDVADDPTYGTVRADLEAEIWRDWDPDGLDERRYQSEERRLAIMRSWANSVAPPWLELS